MLWSLNFEQTLERKPQGSRLLVVMWVTFMLVIGTGYRSNMAAFISFPMREPRPSTFKELQHASEYKVKFDLSGISAWTQFTESTNPMIRNLQRRSRTEHNTSVCVINAFMEQSTVCIGWDFTLTLATAQSMTIPQLHTPLYTSTDSVWAAWYTFALAKNSVFTDTFQFIGQACFERGLTQFWRGRLLKEYQKEGASWLESHTGTQLYKRLVRVRRGGRNETKALTLENFEFMFLILFTGLGLSSLRFLYEILKAHYPFWRKQFCGHYESRHEAGHRMKVPSRNSSVHFVP